MYNYSFQATAPNHVGSVIVTMRVEVTPEHKPADVLGFLRSRLAKEAVRDDWVRKNAPNYGMSVHGGPRPVMSNPDDRSSTILAYEQDFKIVRPI